MQKIDFFIAGVQKGGTTALDAMLREHPSVQMASRKEVHFFDNESVDWTAPDYAILHRHFDWSDETMPRGEATPIYTYWPQSLERLAVYNRAARIVICLRHPAFRAHSQWRMEVARGSDDVPFSEAIRSGRNRFDGAHRVFSYVERGFYSWQIERAQSLFGRVHVLRTDRLWTNTEAEIERLCRFLDVPVFKPHQRYIVPIDTSGAAPMACDDLAWLMELYADDIQRTADLTGVALGDWLDTAYFEPMARQP